MDAGQKYTEEVVKEIEKRLNAEYAAAEKEIQEKLDDYFRRYEIKDKKWQEWVEDGKKTEEQYKAWKTQQLAVGDKWQAQRDMIARDLHNTNEIAKSITRSYMPQVYAENFNYATYDIEHGAKINTSFTLYSRESVERLVRDDPKLLPDPSKRTLKRIADNKDVVWNKQQLQSVMIQGILQGDSIPNLATRLAKTVGERDRKAAVRNARTMATATQNAGRVDAYKRAEDMGVDVEQMWLSTMDDRTRHSHRYLDGETRPLGEAFSNGCLYPADPSGEPEEVYNCRCSLRGVVKGLDRKSGEFRDDSAVGHMSYEEWLEAEPKSNPILLPEEKGEAIRRSYIREYGGYGDGKSKEAETAKPVVYVDENIRTAKEIQKLADTLVNEYNTPLVEVIKGSRNVSAGAGEGGRVSTGMRFQITMVGSDVSTFLHEFGHTLAIKQEDKLGITDNKEFWKEIQKVRTAYNKDTSWNQNKIISNYASTSIDEFMAESFALSKCTQYGIPYDRGYHADGVEWADKVMEVIDKYFKKKK